MDDAAQDYIDAIAAEFRPLFDRLHRLILDEHPDAAITLSYQMPTYTVGRRRLYSACGSTACRCTAGAATWTPVSPAATPD